MILSEPPRSAYDVHFRVFGVPVRIHPLFWLMTLLLGGLNQSPVNALIWVIAVLISVTIHELGHVVAFRRFGIDAYVVLYSFGGLAIPAGQSAYGGYGRPRMTPLERAIVAFAGPAVEIFSAVVLLGLLWVGGATIFFPFSGFMRFLPYTVVESSNYLTTFANDYVYLSILWGLLNLLPIIPLDGGQISQVLFEQVDPRTGTKQALVLSMIMAGLIAALMFVQFRSIYSTIFFAYLGWTNYQAYRFIGYGGGRW